MHHPSLHVPMPPDLAAAWRGDGLPTLPGQRLCLRWIDQDDIGALFGVFSDRDALRWWSHPPFASTDDASIYLEQVHRGHQHGDLLQWGVQRLEDGALIGTAMLAGFDSVQGRAELRLLLGSPHWGQGYGREAAAVLLAHAFHDLALRRVEAEAAPGNRAALKALEALGFKREGYLRQRWLVRGETQDSILLGLLPPDFRAA